MSKSHKTREAVISEPFLDLLFSNLDGVVVVQDFYSVLPSFHIVLCIPLIGWFSLRDHNNSYSKLVQKIKNLKYHVKQDLNHNHNKFISN